MENDNKAQFPKNIVGCGYSFNKETDLITVSYYSHIDLENSKNDEAVGFTVVKREKFLNFAMSMLNIGLDCQKRSGLDFGIKLE